MRKVGKSIFYEKEDEEEDPSDEPAAEEEGREAAEEEREKARQDIVMSEAEYLGNLRILTEAYIKPLCPVLSPWEQSHLFANIHEVIECSERLLGELCSARGSSELTEVLSEAASTYLAPPYIEYCANLPTALTLLSRLVVERDCFRETVSDGECDERGIALQAYLLKPFQRLARLPLLLEPLGQRAASAVRAITKLVEECNNNVREPLTPTTESEEEPECRRSSRFYVEF